MTNYPGNQGRMTPQRILEHAVAAYVGAWRPVADDLEQTWTTPNDPGALTVQRYVEAPTDED
jgi:hypothetical protein